MLCEKPKSLYNVHFCNIHPFSFSQPYNKSFPLERRVTTFIHTPVRPYTKTGNCVILQSYNIEKRMLIRIITAVRFYKKKQENASQYQAYSLNKTQRKACFSGAFPKFREFSLAPDRRPSEISGCWAPGYAHRRDATGSFADVTTDTCRWIRSR